MVYDGHVSFRAAFSQDSERIRHCLRHCLRFEVSPEELQRRVCSVLGAEKVLGRAMEIDGTPVLEIVKKEYLGISRILRS